MTMRSVTTLIVGAGQAGLAMSRELSQRGVDHVLIERGRIGESWRRRAWDGLRLQTPNWANGLPGVPYSGCDRHGFMAIPELVERLGSYATLIGAPVQEHTAVEAVRAVDAGFEVATSSGPFRCRNLVVASGACARPAVPELAGGVPPKVHQLTPLDYRRAGELPPGGVLVVGASASGVEIASELMAAGRRVTLAVGHHQRLPRTYRGRDIEWWLDAIGALDQRTEAMDAAELRQKRPSPQLTGGADPVDLTALQGRGVEIVGRLMAMRDGRALFSGGLAHACTMADLSLGHLCGRIDDWVARHLPAAGAVAPHRFAPTPVPHAPRLQLDLRSGEIAAIVWATGFEPDHTFLDLPVFDRHGRLAHSGGVVAGIEGLYALGLPFQRRRRSALLSGVGRDARDLATHLEQRLKATRRRARPSRAGRSNSPISAAAQAPRRARAL